MAGMRTHLGTPCRLNVMRGQIEIVLGITLRALFLAFCVGLPLYGQGAIEPRAEFNQRFWQARDGLPFSSVQALVQSPDGYLWIGTSGGLIRFDGSSFDLYNHSSSAAFQDDSVLSLAVERDGTLWIGTEGGGLIRYRNGTFHHFGRELGFNNQFVRALYVDSDDGSLWVGTDHGIFRGNAVDGLRRLDEVDGIPETNVYTIVGRKGGDRYVGGSELLVIGKNHTQFFDPRERSVYDPAFSICPTHDGTVWMGTPSALRRLSPNDRTDIYTQSHVIPVPAPTDSFDRGADGGGLQAKRHWIYSAMTEAIDGSLWIGTDGEGLLHWKDGHFRWFRAPEYLPGNHITSILEDSHKDIWVGTTSGLARLKPTPTEFVQLANSVPVNVRTISNDQGSLLVSTVEGQLLSPASGHLSKVLTPAGVQSIPVRTTFRDREGTLWIGTGGIGLLAYRPNGSVERYPQINLIRVFAETPDGTLWIGADGGLWSIAKGKWAGFPTENGSFRALAVDRDGVLWAGSDYDFFCIRDGHVVNVPGLNLLRSLKIWSIFIDREGAVWIGTRGAGLYLWDSGKLRHYGSSNGFPTDSIFSVLEDQFHQMWISGSNGLWSIDRKALLAAPDGSAFYGAIHSFGNADVTMNGGFHPAGTITSSGDLWFPTSIGALNVHPEEPKPSESFALVIQKIRADGSPFPIKSPVIVEPSVQRIEIDYSAIRLDSPEQTRFTYMLEGLDSRWTDAGSLRTAAYTHVPPGDYLFRVRAFDQADPDQTIEAKVRIRFKPHFYQARWFFMLCALFVLSAAIAAFQLKQRQLEQRFELVLRERHRVAREVHDTIIQGCIGISTLLEAAKSTEESFPEKSKSLVGRARMQVMVLVDEARNAVWNLRHKASPEQMLGGALELAVAELQQEGRTPITLEIRGALPPVSESVCRNIILIVREALMNSIHHACASRIQLSVRGDTRKLTITASDDGQGFNPEAGRLLHFGIIGMRERARSLRGDLVLTSSVDRGTTIKLALRCSRLSRERLEHTT